MLGAALSLTLALGTAPHFFHQIALRPETVTHKNSSQGPHGDWSGFGKIDNQEVHVEAARDAGWQIT